MGTKVIADRARARRPAPSAKEILLWQRNSQRSVEICCVALLAALLLLHALLEVTGCPLLMSMCAVCPQGNEVQSTSMRTAGTAMAAFCQGKLGRAGSSRVAAGTGAPSSVNPTTIPSTRPTPLYAVVISGQCSRDAVTRVTVWTRP